MPGSSRRPILARATAALLAWVAAPAALACTAAVILGTATEDGRPLLWKNRDTGNRPNEVRWFGPRTIDGRTTRAFVAVTNAGSSLPWAGLNADGFAIINTLTRDMRGAAEARGPGNGSFMREALRWCASVDDFERLLARTDGKRATVATFSVIDAHGRGATYETGPDRHVAFDAADEAVAGASCVDGAVVRTNFTFTAEGFGPGTRPTAGDVDNRSWRRFARAEELFESAATRGKLNLRTVLRDFARDHDVDRQPGELWDTRETISRRTSVSTIVVHGVMPGEDPRLATMWVILGEASLSVAVPVWVASGGTSAVLDGDETSPLSDAAEALRARVYCDTDDGPRLQSELLPGIQQDTLALEESILARAEAALAGWRKNGVSGEAMRSLQDELCAEALARLQAERAELGTP